MDFHFESVAILTVVGATSLLCVDCGIAFIVSVRVFVHDFQPLVRRILSYCKSNVRWLLGRLEFCGHNNTKTPPNNDIREPTQKAIGNKAKQLQHVSFQPINICI